MDNNFLLTYSFTNREGMYEDTYKWFEFEEEMIDFVNDMRNILEDFKVIESMEVLETREVTLL